MQKLLLKIQQVSQKLKSIEKDMQVGKGFNSYKAVSDLSVILKVKEAESEVKIISIPIKQELIKTEIVKVTKKGKDESSDYEGIVYVDIIKMTVGIYDLESEDHIEIESFGRGWDASDKGFGKASTYARKYALLNAYKIATGEDPDSEPSEKQTIITEDEKSVFVIDYLEKDVKYANTICKHFGVDTIKDLSTANKKQIYDTITKKK